MFLKTSIQILREFSAERFLQHPRYIFFLLEVLIPGKTDILIKNLPSNDHFKVANGFFDCFHYGHLLWHFLLIWFDLFAGVSCWLLSLFQRATVISFSSAPATIFGLKSSFPCHLPHLPPFFLMEIFMLLAFP